MTCEPCRFARQLVMNWLLTIDMAANVLLLGRPGETISARLGRAEETGSKVAAFICKGLNWMSTAGDQGHCAWAADPLQGSLGGELWNWNLPDKAS